MDNEAAVWAARIDANPDAAFPDLEAWLSADPKHSGALLRAQAALVALGDQPEPANDEEICEESAAGIWRGLVVGAGVLAACAAALVAFLFMPAQEMRYDTGAGETQIVALDDGSSMSIDAKTSVAVAYDDNVREITLSDGRALFRAADDPARPFRVVVDDIVITDIGTEFQVFDNTVEGVVEVLVTEGEVLIESPQGSRSLVMGEKVQIVKSSGQIAATPMAALSSSDLARATAWREGRLDLDGETLGDAVQQLNRANKVQIEIASPGLADEELFGSFRMDDPRGFAGAAAISLDARVSEVDGKIRIER